MSATTPPKIVQACARAGALDHGLSSEEATAVGKLARDHFRERFGTLKVAPMKGQIKKTYDRIALQRDAAIALYAEAAGIGMDTAQQMVIAEADEQAEIRAAS